MKTDRPQVIYVQFPQHRRDEEGGSSGRRPSHRGRLTASLRFGLFLVGLVATVTLTLLASTAIVYAMLEIQAALAACQA